MIKIKSEQELEKMSKEELEQEFENIYEEELFLTDCSPKTDSSICSFYLICKLQE